MIVRSIRFAMHSMHMLIVIPLTKILSPYLLLIFFGSLDLEIIKN